MRQVKVQVSVYRMAGKKAVYGVALLPNTNADTLQDMVDTILEDNHFDPELIEWEAFFYTPEPDGMILAYLSDNSQHEEYVSPEVLKLQ